VAYAWLWQPARSMVHVAATMTLPGRTQSGQQSRACDARGARGGWGGWGSGLGAGPPADVIRPEGSKWVRRFDLSGRPAPPGLTGDLDNPLYQVQSHNSLNRGEWGRCGWGEGSGWGWCPVTGRSAYRGGNGPGGTQPGRSVQSFWAYPWSAGCQRRNVAPWSSTHSAMNPYGLRSGSSARPPAARTRSTAAAMSSTR
jgi:hypothetical protein